METTNKVETTTLFDKTYPNPLQWRPGNDEDAFIKELDNTKGTLVVSVLDPTQRVIESLQRNQEKIIALKIECKNYIDDDGKKIFNINKLCEIIQNSKILKALDINIPLFEFDLKVDYCRIPEEASTVIESIQRNSSLEQLVIHTDYLGQGTDDIWDEIEHLKEENQSVLINLVTNVHQNIVKAICQLLKNQPTLTQFECCGLDYFFDRNDVVRLLKFIQWRETFGISVAVKTDLKQVSIKNADWRNCIQINNDEDFDHLLILLDILGKLHDLSELEVQMSSSHWTQGAVEYNNTIIEEYARQCYSRMKNSSLPTEKLIQLIRDPAQRRPAVLSFYNLLDKLFKEDHPTTSTVSSYLRLVHNNATENQYQSFCESVLIDIFNNQHELSDKLAMINTILSIVPNVIGNESTSSYFKVAFMFLVNPDYTFTLDDAKKNSWNNILKMEKAGNKQQYIQQIANNSDLIITLLVKYFISEETCKLQEKIEKSQPLEDEQQADLGGKRKHTVAFEFGEYKSELSAAKVCRLE